MSQPVVVRLSLILLASSGPMAVPARAMAPLENTVAASNQAKDPALAELLQKAGAYVAGYESTFSDLLAEERYTQHLLHSSETGGRRSRVTRSELIFVRLPGDISWTTFRDVFESDGRAVRDRESRLEKLFVNPDPNAEQQAEAILKESARFNLGRTWRNFNVPVSALPFLHPRNQDRFAFERKGTRTIEGVRAVQVRYEEVRRPSLIQDTEGGSLPARGDFFVDPLTGRVLRTELKLALNEAAEVSLLVDFRPEPKLDIWVPSEMREFWGLSSQAQQANAGGHRVGTAEHIECVARYSNYRRFTVKTQEDIHLTADPDARPSRP